MTEADYAMRVYQRITGGKPDDASPVLRSAIQLGLTDVLNELAARVYNSPQRAALEKVYTPNLVSGAVDLTSGFSDLWFESLRTGRCYYVESDGSLTEINFYSNPLDLDLPGISGLYRASLDGNTYIVRDETGGIPANSTLRMTLGTVPTLTTLATNAPHLHNDLIKLGAEYNLEVVRGAEAQQTIA